VRRVLEDYRTGGFWKERNKPWTEGVFAVLTAEPTEETYEIVQRWQRLVQEFLCLQANTFPPLGLHSWKSH